MGPCRASGNDTTEPLGVGMTARDTRRPRALTTPEVLALPAMVDSWPTAAAACGGIGRTAWHQLAARNEAPVPIIRVGGTNKVRRADLLAFLGLPMNDDSAPVAPETPSSERDHQTTTKQIGTRS
ncbi:hypothetical protein GCM10010387_22640 [Streptomyces inusitatus]|uniref:Helix-turn-helix domain-containing protein n=1 Tax=Streptomyces inusitatus TaxID=68221 RepID=A0A918Q115_9ACTN|nr:hypothetical protein GCM10010387_22640 [Streptomyces inusitatus]